MKLYEINEQIQEIIDSAVIDEETGEKLIKWEDLDKLNLAKDEKVENLIKWYLDTQGDIAKFATELKSLQERKEALENRQVRLKEFLGSFDLKEYGTHKLSQTKSTAVVGESLESLTGTMIRTERVPVKAEIKIALQLGQKIEGWELQDRLNIQIK